MQANTLTLAVDTANNGTTTDQVYTRFREVENKSVYNGPDGSVSNRQELAFLRKDPKRSGNSQGVSSAEVRLTEEVSVAGVEDSSTVSHLLTGSVSFRIPVGVSSADLLEFRQKIIAVLDDDVIAGALMDNLEI
jgi:hypothetical protein